ncbi:MAG: outer membrane beta-barrel protein [Arenibacter latericius]|nr:outer membrane beta-barrel protein [Arenibacter latericius]
MSENKLDKLFQEKLADFQETPDSKVWSSIEASLDKKGKSRRVIPLWWKLGGVAAVLTFLFLVVNPFSDTTSVEPIITDVENRVEKDVNNEKHSIIEESIKEAPSLTTVQDEKVEPETDAVANVGAKQKDNTVTTASVSDKEEADLKYQVSKKVKAIGVADGGSEIKDIINPVLEGGPALEENKSPDDHQLVNGDTFSKKGENKLVENTEASLEETDPKKKSIFDEIENREEDIAVATSKGGKWSAGPSVAPVYFNGIGGGSPINSILASNTKTGNVTLSYGVNVAYEVSKKVSIRTGVHKVDFGYNTNDVSFSSSFQAPAQAQLKNINYNNTAQSIVLRETSRPLGLPPSDVQVALDFTGKSPTRMGTMGQQIGYLEVPLEVNYAVLDSKFGVNLIGGLSSLFLTDNVVVLQSSGQTTELGEANNINSVNFSTNIGLGLNYQFNDNLRLNVEPVFKYQLNTFNDTSGSFNPYSVGVYSGFSFKF